MKNGIFGQWVLVVWLSLFAVSQVFGLQDSVKKTHVTISSIENEQTHEIAKHVVMQAYQRLGVDVSFLDLPARRALEWANAGKTDGDLARIDGTEKTFTNLIKLSVPVIEFQGVVFTRHVNRDIRSWNDLNGLVVGIIGGIRYSDIGTQGLERIETRDMTQLFTLLSKDHIDVAIAGYDAGTIETHKQFSGSGIHAIGQPIYSAGLYHFIHNKNKDLIPKLESVLQSMATTGEIAAITQRTLSEMVSQ